MIPKFWILGCALVLAGGLLPAGAADAPRPNMVVLLADDLGWAYPGFTGGLVEMPNLEKVAARSVVMTQFYVQPVCTPTRSALLTGRYPLHTGTEGRFEGGHTHGMLTDERTLADALREAGYFTAIFGKWHLGNWRSVHLPMARGFDYQYGFYGAMVDYYRKMRLKRSPRPGFGYEDEAPEGTFTYDWHRNQRPLIQNGYTTYLIADEVEAVLDRRQPDQPFFFYVAFNAAHSPNGPQQVPAEYRKKYPQVRHTQAFCLDEAIGRIVEGLTRRGLLENTILIFLNDNGGVVKPGETSTENGPWRGGKGTFYEGGVRVPCVVSWPVRIREPQRVEAPAHAVDFYPTLVRLGGGRLEQPLPVDGIDMAHLWMGEEGPKRDTILFSRHVIREGDWKFIAKEQGYMYPNEEPGQGDRPEDELFNLRLDPREEHNVAGVNPKVVARLRARLVELSQNAREGEISGHVPRFETVTIMGEEEAKNFRGVNFGLRDGFPSLEPKP